MHFGLYKGYWKSLQYDTIMYTFWSMWRGEKD